jgi:multimeric flavodoxin WrbA
MKILVVQGSPRGAQGNTEVLVQAFLEGAKEAGATQTEVAYLKGKTIKHCIGCFTCWTRTPGVCCHHDDMPELLMKARDADMVVMATPLYYYTMTGMLKDFMDRCLPLGQPFMDIKDGLCCHPPRYRSGLRNIVLISNAGFPEQAHFNGLKETFRVLAHGDNGRIKGMICCAGGATLHNKEQRGMFQWYLDAVKKAGTEVVREGQVSEATTAVLDRPLFGDQVAYAEHVNQHWTSMGVQRVDPA